MWNRFQRGCGWAAAISLLTAGALRAEPSVGSSNPAFDLPIVLLAVEEDSVYATPPLPRDDLGTNQGGVNFSLDVMNTSDYVFRGIDRSEVGGTEDAPNIQFDSTLTFDLGKFPHPFIGVFVNVFNSDPISRFQEIRPYFGIDWTIRPIHLILGHVTYLFPERDETNSSEIFGKLTIDDSVLWGTEKPIFSPYLLAAYDYDLYNGWYFEFGISHDFVIEDTGLTITPTARVAYVTTYQLFAVDVDGDDSGFQHYDVGFTVEYSLNQLLSIPPRYGDWSLQGQCFYTDGISNELRADTQVWGGIGIGFRY